jgi:Domain of unknown function (DUF4145)
LNCERHTALEFVDEYFIWPKWADGDREPPMYQYAKLIVWRCTYCNRTTGVRFNYEESAERYRAPVSSEIVWPQRAPRELPGQAPASLRSLYQEASLAESAGALRGAAGLYRAAVEELCRDRGATGDSLKKKVDALAGLGVDDDIVEDLHEARLTGNWSLHEGLQFSAEEVADVADLIHDAVETLYVQPARRAELRAAREARRQQRHEEGPSTV